MGSVELRTEYDIWDRPHYAYGVLSAVRLARSLGLDGITVIEFGVAGGNGLVALEELSLMIADHAGIDVDVVGFDAGSGMPSPIDYRDIAHVWAKGFYEMDVDRLEERLTHARLVIGPVETTVTETLESFRYPIGFISFDLDYYSSTRSAFAVFSAAERTRLPRVFCYFDDVILPERAYHNEYTGELLAIREFNEEHDLVKIARIEGLVWMRRCPARWNEQMYVLHDFEHSRYTQLVTRDGDAARQLPLR